MFKYLHEISQNMDLLVSVKKNYINVSNHKIWNFFFSSNKAIYWCLANKISREREKVNWNFNRFITHVGTVLNKDILSFICFPLHGAAKVCVCVLCIFLHQFSYFIGIFKCVEMLIFYGYTVTLMDLSSIIVKF